MLTVSVLTHEHSIQRESEVQTDPYTPEYTVTPGSAPEVLTLATLSYGMRIFCYYDLPAGTRKTVHALYFKKNQVHVINVNCLFFLLCRVPAHGQVLCDEEKNLKCYG